MGFYASNQDVTNLTPITMVVYPPSSLELHPKFRFCSTSLAIVGCLGCFLIGFTTWMNGMEIDQIITYC